MMAADMLQIDSNSYSQEHFLVQFRPETPASSLIGTSVAGVTISRQVSSDGWFKASVNEGSNFSIAMQTFQAMNNVAFVSPDFRVSIATTPNDPMYVNQWGFENSADKDIDASQAWNFGTSSSVVVAVIDTGIDYNHPDLAANIWTNTDEVAGNGIDDDSNGYIDDIRGWNFINETNNPMDDHGHGTHVAGTVGAVGNNGIGVVGVAWNVKLMALKFLNASGSGNLSDAVEAIDYARVNGAKIINASFGGGGFSNAMQTAIQRFQNAGGIFVAAAGNSAQNNAVVASYPANYPGVISVAASTSTDTLASFSNYGTNVHIAAPGQGIRSTLPGNRYGNMNGTSMAAPHVAGALALLWGQSPTLTASLLTSAIFANTDQVLTDKTIYGRMNVGKTAAAISEGDGESDIVAPQVVGSVFNAAGKSLTSVDVSFSEEMDAATMVPSNFILNGPNGLVSVSSVIRLTGNNWRLNFATQTFAGLYSLTVLPTVKDVAGNLLNQDGDATAGETTEDRYTSAFTLNPSALRSYTFNGPVTLRDATSTRAGVTNIDFTVPDSFTIADLNVNLSINHTHVSDLRVRLISPDGTSVQLVNRRGGSSDNIRVTFDDEATTNISNAATLSGTFRPERTLSAFDGKNASGRWRLEIVDSARLDVGVFNSIQLLFTESVVGAGSGSSSSPSKMFSFDESFDSSARWMSGWVAQTVEQWLRRFVR
jgi:subtilisin family serine protease